jgi:catabolite regulation protein CreA
MTIKKIKDYIEKELNKTPRHNCKALAKSITKVSKLFNENENELMYLLLENKPINGSYTHSYGFHTAYGRDLINTMSEYYYKYNQ